MSESTITLRDKFGDRSQAKFVHTDEDGTFIVYCELSGDELVRGRESNKGEFDIFSTDPSFDVRDLTKQLEEQMSALRHPTVEFPHS